MKIIIPTAGWATRMRPQTWSKPKPLVSVAGRTAMDHLLASFDSLPGVNESELVIIYSSGLGETQLPPYMAEHYPGRKVHYVLQAVMKGQSDALWLAREHLQGPLIICFSDTLIQADFSILDGRQPDGIAWVKPVPDPRRFGVAELDKEGWVTRLVEKPTSMENNRVVVGCYYFREGEALLAAVEEQVRRGATIKGEYFLTEGINIMLEHGLKMRTETVETGWIPARSLPPWRPTGSCWTGREWNRPLTGPRKNAPAQGVSIIRLSSSMKQPKFTMPPSDRMPPSGKDARSTMPHIEDSILEMGVSVESASLTGSFVGRRAKIVGLSMDDPPMRLNIGDDSSVFLK